jgi:uncharacterized protein YkwD
MKRLTLGLIPILFFAAMADTAFALRPEDVSIQQAEVNAMVKRSENRAKSRKQEVEGEITLSSTFKSQRYRALVRSKKELIRDAIDKARSSASVAVTRRPSFSSSSSSSSRSSVHSTSSVSSRSERSSSSSFAYAGNALSQEVLSLVNAERAKANLKALQLNSFLTQSAQDYAHLMSEENFFSHTDPDGNASFERISDAGYLTPPCDCQWQYYTGENLGKNQANAKEVVEAWMASESHRANVLRPQFTDMGIGYENGYWVQHFGAKKEY